MSSETKLPPFVKFYNISDEYTITKNGQKYTVVEDNRRTFPTFDEAYTHVRQTLNATPIFNIDEIADENLTKTLPFMLSSPEGRLYMSTSMKDIIEGTMSDYDTFLNETTPKYEKNPDKLLTAWDFLNTHPIFWSHDPDRPDFWSTMNGLDTLEISIWPNMKQEPKILLETGPYESVEKNGTTYEHAIRTLDPDLTVETDTFENGVIQLAKKVHTLYNLDGSRKN